MTSPEVRNGDEVGVSRRLGCPDFLYPDLLAPNVKYLALLR